jgi:hypothetical protein
MFAVFIWQVRQFHGLKHSVHNQRGSQTGPQAEKEQRRAMVLSKYLAA